MSDKVAEVLWLIRTMTSAELLELRNTLGGEFGDFGPDIGTREPRRPRPTLGGAARVLTEQEDE